MRLSIRAALFRVFAAIQMLGSRTRLIRPCPFLSTKVCHLTALRSFNSATYRLASIMTTANGTSLDGPQANGQHKKINAWQQPGPAAFDFRSDTITTPTASMLDAIANTTLMDDVFVEDPTTNELEADMAALAGHEAALLVMSGTMGNQVALRALLTQPPHSVLCDRRSHIVNYEAGGVSSLTGALVMGVVPRNGVYLTLEDIKENAILSDDVHACPTRVISLENTLAGTIMPLEEVRKISAFARENDIKMHLDGARIWEAVAANAGSLPEFTTCFDSVSMCFSKGLGAPIGSIIVGPVTVHQACTKNTKIDRRRHAASWHHCCRGSSRGRRKLRQRPLGRRRETQGVPHASQADRRDMEEQGRQANESDGDEHGLA